MEDMTALRDKDKKSKSRVLLYTAAASVTVCLISWIVMLYAERSRVEKGWENEFLMRYSAVLNDVTHHLGCFEEADSYEGQISYLELVVNDLMQLKAFMEMHSKLAAVTEPDSRVSGADQEGWKEAERVAWFIGSGGIMGSDQIEPFRADGVISEGEAAVVRFMKEETEKLYHDMTVSDKDGMNYRYDTLSAIEVYQRLTELMSDVRRMLTQGN